MIKAVFYDIWTARYVVNKMWLFFVGATLISGLVMSLGPILYLMFSGGLDMTGDMLRAMPGLVGKLTVQSAPDSIADLLYMAFVKNSMTNKYVLARTAIRH